MSAASSPDGTGPSADGNEESEPKRRALVWIVVGVIVLVAIVGGLFVVLGGGDEAAAGEVFLSPAASVGPDPYSSTPLAEPPDASIALAVEQARTTVTVGSSAAVSSTSGGTPGLYGGTMNKATCDPQQIVEFLASEPDKAAAWVAALNADPKLQFGNGRRLDVASIPEYIATLTPTILLQDTRVTNHGYRNGKPTRLQSVLQKGTAVLVDQYGVPRVKCYCGNPLLPPVPATSKPTYTGNRWKGFDPARIGAVQPSPTVINVFVLTDPSTGQRFDRPVGTTGAGDVANSSVPPSATTLVPGSTSLAPGGSSTTAPPGATTTRPRGATSTTSRSATTTTAVQPIIIPCCARPGDTTPPPTAPPATTSPPTTAGPCPQYPGTVPATIYIQNSSSTATFVRGPSCSGGTITDSIGAGASRTFTTTMPGNWVAEKGGSPYSSHSVGSASDSWNIT